MKTNIKTKLFAVIVSLFVFGAAVQAKTFVLVHGAFAASSGWSEVKQRLEAKGNKVIAADLPAHGADNTPATSVTFDVYRDSVVRIVESQNEKVILVGHSMAGMIVSEVAERVPNRIEKLIYIGALLPKNGDSSASLTGRDKEVVLKDVQIVSADGSTVLIKREEFADIFCADCTNAQKQALLKNDKDEAIAPLIYKVSLTAQRFGVVPKYYVETTEDKSIGIALQREMVAENGTVKKVFTIKTGHLPFVSQPKKMTKILQRISQSK